MLVTCRRGIKMKTPVIQVENIKKYFPIKKGLFNKRNEFIKAVDGLSFTINQGETFGLVGESGCGKSTTGRMIMKLIESTEGKITLQGEEITNLTEEEFRPFRKDIQMIFQDPFASLNPRMKIGDIIEEPLIIHGFSKKNRRSKVNELLNIVGLNRHYASRYPHQFSGGQRQRVGIARALVLNPKLIIADEPVSALDVSIQSQILNLLKELQTEFDLTYLFIGHDLSVIEHISDRVGVMYLGKIVEISDRDELYKDPLHPYTKSLLSAVPVPDPRAKKERIILRGEIPSPANPPSGCTFHTRCPYAIDKCKVEIPEFKEVAKRRFVACHLVDK